MPRKGPLDIVPSLELSVPLDLDKFVKIQVFVRDLSYQTRLGRFVVPKPEIMVPGLQICTGSSFERTIL